MIVLGRVAAPFGVKGWVKVQAFADDVETWFDLPRWWLAADVDALDSDWRSFEVREVREHGGGLIANLKGVVDRNGAEALDRMYIGAPREELPAPDADEYYWADLVGLEVVNEDGVVLGKVDRLLETGANDVLVVKQGECERLLPFVGPVVRDVDRAAGRIRVAWQVDW